MLLRGENMLVFAGRRRDALLDGNPPELSPTLTEEEWGVGGGANVVKVEEETRGVSDESVELVLSWLSRIRQGGVPLRSRMRSIASETLPEKMAVHAILPQAHCSCAHDSLVPMINECFPSDKQFVDKFARTNLAHKETFEYTTFTFFALRQRGRG